MKLFNKILLLFAASCLLFVACEDEDDFTPGPTVEGQGYFFSSELSSSITLGMADTSFEVIVGRSESGSAATVNLTSTVTATVDDVPDVDMSELFDIPSSVSFGADDLSSSFDVTFDVDEIGYTTYNFLIEIADDDTTPYGRSSYEFTVAVSQPWVTLGMATFCDYFYFVDSYQVELQQNGVYPNKFRLIDPYVQGLIDEEHMTDPPTDNDLNFLILEPGKTYAEQTGNSWYDDMVITLEDLVCFEPINPGWFYDYYSSYVWVYHPSYWSIWPDEGDWTYSRVLEYQDNGLPAIVQLAPMYYLSEDGRYWNYTTYDEMVLIYFPGNVIKDYSVEVEYEGKYTDTKDANYLIANVTLGEDVESVRVGLVEGKDVSAALDAVVAGTVDYVQVTADGTVLLPCDESGTYTIVVVSYADGEPQDYDYVTIKVELGAAETYSLYGTGDYEYSIYLTGPDPGLELYQSDTNPNHFKIEHWAYDVDFYFTWDQDTNEVVVEEDQPFGATYGSYGDILVDDLSDYAGVGSGTYSNGTFYFAMAYYVSAGYLAYGVETFTLEGTTPDTFTVDDLVGTYLTYGVSDYGASRDEEEDWEFEASDDSSKGNFMITNYNGWENYDTPIYGTIDEDGLISIDTGTGGVLIYSDTNYDYYFVSYDAFNYDGYYGTELYMTLLPNGTFIGPLYADYICELAYAAGTSTPVGWNQIFDVVAGTKYEVSPNALAPRTKDETKVQSLNGSRASVMAPGTKAKFVKPATVAKAASVASDEVIATKPAKGALKTLTDAPIPGTPSK